MEYIAAVEIKAGQVVTISENKVVPLNPKQNFKLYGIAAHDMKEGDKILFSSLESTPDILVAFPKTKFVVITNI